jgi:cell division protein FtsZ
MTLDDMVRGALLSYETGGETRVSSDTSSGQKSGTDTLVPGTGMLVIGIGTAGTKIVERLHHLAGPGLRTLTINSDQELFENSSASSRFFLKYKYFSGGFGLCGGDPDLVDRYAQAARTASPDIEPLLGNPEFCFIVAGMGGNMENGAAPVIARMMRERGAVVTAIVTRPFAIEGRRKLRAEPGIIELGKAAHTIIILEFEKLKAVLPKVMVLPQQFSVMNHIIALSIRNIWECTYSASFVNFECEDLHYMLEHGKTGTLLLGEFPLNEKQSCRTFLKFRYRLWIFPFMTSKDVSSISLQETISVYSRPTSWQ